MSKLILLLALVCLLGINVASATFGGLGYGGLGLEGGEYSVVRLDND